MSDTDNRSNSQGNPWYTDVLNLITRHYRIDEEFTLGDVMTHARGLAEKHPNNQNVDAKIRQQLQFLRDNRILEFLGRGHYRRIS